VSEDNSDFRSWATLHCLLKAGTQIFEIEDLPSRSQYLKLIVHDVHGADRVYINQIFLFPDYNRAMISNSSPAIKELPNSSLVYRRSEDGEAGLPSSLHHNQRRVPTPLRHYEPAVQYEPYKPSPSTDKKYEVDPKLKLERQLQDLQESIRTLKNSRLDFEPLPKSARGGVKPLSIKYESEELKEINAKVDVLMKKVAELQNRLDSAEEEVSNLSSVTIPRASYREATFRPKSADTTFTAAFESHIKEWESKVLSPALARIRVESSRGSSPEQPKVRELLKQLHFKQAQRTTKLYQLNKEKERRLRDAPYLREYDDYVSLEDFSR